mmetsp:Transcript_16598/g.24521  ORF Transcript_16598/g.24521 Transcript_16598/m.24521 type:complete len:620 (-) Transcript_16598:95-1954(-)
MTRRRTPYATLTTLLLTFLTLTSAKRKARVKSGTRYNLHDPVHLVVNKVGPFNNPSETYRYYSFPFCKDHHVEPEVPGGAKDFTRKGGERHKLRFGESITGDRRETSPYEIDFQANIEWRLLCKQALSSKEVERFKDAVQNNFFFEFFIEDLPMWGYFGEVISDSLFDEGRVYLYPHLHFKIGHNNGQITSVAVYTQSSFKVDITDGQEQDVEFSYSVEFNESNVRWSNRFEKYTDSKFYPHKSEVHWLSILNSVVLVLLLMGFLVLILMRVLKQDFVRYMGDAENQENEVLLPDEETGWKLLHGDVFRCPKYSELFSAVIGTGIHLIFCTSIVQLLCLTNIISTTFRGQILSTTIVIYSLTGFVGGFASARTYHICTRGASTNWILSLLFTLTLFGLPTSVVFMYVNTIAIQNSSSAALPFTAILTVLSLQLFLTLPSTVVGNMMGRYTAPKVEFPTRTTKVARQIPGIVWWKGAAVQILVGGCLPFSAIYIELHYIFASLWGHAIYTLFGILFLSLLLLLVVVSFVTVALLYFQLQNEHHEWWWRSIFVGGSTGFFLYAYSFLYFFHRSDMGGMLQGSFFFGYMWVISFAVFLMLGAMSWCCGYLFVRYIYGRIKCD